MSQIKYEDDYIINIKMFQLAISLLCCPWSCAGLITTLPLKSCCVYATMLLTEWLLRPEIQLGTDGTLHNFVC